MAWATSLSVASRMMGKDITFVTCFHGRAWLSEIFLEHTLGMGPVVAGCSKGDFENIALCERYGVPHVVVENRPLGAKWNAAWELAGGRRMIVGSDDLVNPAYYAACVASGASYIMPGSCAFWEQRSGAACLMRWGGADGLLYGTGRVVDHDGPLWTPMRNKGLDQDSHCRLIAMGHKAKRLEVYGPCVTDVKTGENLWGYHQVSGRSSPVSADVALCHVAPELVARLVRWDERAPRRIL